MKTFKALYIDNGIIKANEFPVEPEPKASIYADELTLRRYEQAIVSAKANALLISNPEVLDGVLPERMKEAKGRIVPLCPGWDYEEKVVSKQSEDGWIQAVKVAKLYRTDEQPEPEERMYTLEDMEDCWDASRDHFFYSEYYPNFNEWIKTRKP